LEDRNTISMDISNINKLQPVATGKCEEKYEK
jgi:hypothetical protein